MNYCRWKKISIGILLMGCVSAHALDEPGFTLNLNNADILALINMVSKQTGKNFIVDPRVSAKVTVVSTSPVDAEELYELFLSVLQVHGYSTVPAGGGLIKIVPDNAAKQGPIPLMPES